MSDLLALNYDNYTPEKMLEEVAALVACMAHEFFYDTAGSFKEWQKFDTDDLSQMPGTRWVEDLEPLRDEIKGLLESFGLEYEEVDTPFIVEKEVDCEETVMDLNVTHEPTPSKDIVEYKGGILPAASPGSPLMCDKCHMGPRSYHIPSTPDWVCLNCWQEHRRDLSRHDQEGSTGETTHHHQKGGVTPPGQDHTRRQPDNDPGHHQRPPADEHVHRRSARSWTKDLTGYEGNSEPEVD